MDDVVQGLPVQGLPVRGVKVRLRCGNQQTGTQFQVFSDPPENYRPTSHPVN